MMGELADSLASPVIRISQGGHLLASDGFTRLPQALQVVEAALQGGLFLPGAPGAEISAPSP